MKQINHVIFAIDTSGSMMIHQFAIDDIIDSIFQSMKDALSGSETRVSLYNFNTFVTSMIRDEDAKLIRKLPAMPVPGGVTALMDATGIAISDHLNMKTRKDEDHAFLLYVITDGAEYGGASRRFSPESLSKLINSLPDNWTVATMVPNQTSVAYAKRYGFPAGNIEIWNTTSTAGLEEARNTVINTMSTYSAVRASGGVGTKSLFRPDLTKLAKAAVKNDLHKVTGRIYIAQKEYQIRDFTEMSTGKTYVKGSAYYELIKPETVQPQKEIVIVPAKNKDGIKYGGDSARSMLGLPDHSIRIGPGDHGDWRIFIQSTSVNRKIVKGNAVFIKD